MSWPVRDILSHPEGFDHGRPQTALPMPSGTRARCRCGGFDYQHRDDAP